jgi:tetraprenyl-beta-curcumene synthase
MPNDARMSPPAWNITKPGPVPMGPQTLRTLGISTARHLRWGLPSSGREVRRWRALAEQIPDPFLRADALQSIVDKRAFTDGAALFWTLPSRRDDELLALLVAFQTIANYLDCTSERGAKHRGSSAGSLMLALVDAVDVESPLQDYYADHPWTEDGGFLRELVLSCRSGCQNLAHYQRARPLLIREARRGRTLELSHDPNAQRRDEVLEAFAAREYAPPPPDANWFEYTVSSTSLLPVIVLLALAADETSTDHDLHAALDVYIPWVGALSVMLDSYNDEADDADSLDWSAISYYADAETAQQRITVLIDRALRDTFQLRHGPRHAFIVSAMIAMYVTSESATSALTAANTRQLRRASGGMTAALMPVLRGWRVVHRQRR